MAVGSGIILPTRCRCFEFFEADDVRYSTDMQNVISKASLRFNDAREERRFVDQYVNNNTGWTQIAMLLGALTYVSYTIWDWVLYPQIVPTTFAIRGGVAAFVLLPLTFLLSTPLKRWAEIIHVVYCVVPGCVLTGIYIIIPSGFLHAAAGMIIVILFVSTLLPLRLGSLAIFCGLTWTSLLIGEHFGPELPAGLRFINHFEIGTAYALSLWAVGARRISGKATISDRRGASRRKRADGSGVRRITCHASPSRTG